MCSLTRTLCNHARGSRFILALDSASQQRNLGRKESSSRQNAVPKHRQLAPPKILATTLFENNVALNA